MCFYKLNIRLYTLKWRLTIIWNKRIKLYWIILLGSWRCIGTTKRSMPKLITTIFPKSLLNSKRLCKNSQKGKTRRLWSFITKTHWENTFTFTLKGWTIRDTTNRKCNWPMITMDRASWWNVSKLGEKGLLLKVEPLSTLLWRQRMSTKRRRTIDGFRWRL